MGEALKRQIRQQAEANEAKNNPEAALKKMQAAIDLKKLEEAEAQRTGYDKNGKPVENKWQSLLGENGLIQDKYKMKDWQNVNPNTDALNAYSQQAMRAAGTPSASAQALLAKQQLEQGTMMDQSATMGRNALQGTMSSLAQNGGLSGGARERAMRQANLMQLMGRQSTLRQGMQDRAGIMSADEGQRMGQLQTLQGMQNTQADAALNNQKMQYGIEEKNLGASVGEFDKKRLAENEAYKARMAAWGAEKSANAQAAASRGGGKK